MTDLIEFRRQRQIKKRAEELAEQVEKQNAALSHLQTLFTTHEHENYAAKTHVHETYVAKTELPKPYMHPKTGLCPQKPQPHRHIAKDIANLKIPEPYDFEQLKKDHPKLREPYLHDPKQHSHPSSEITDRIQPSQIERKGLDADTVDGKHAKELVKRIYAGGGGAPSAHATTHQDGGIDEINVAGLSGELADPQTPKTHGHPENQVTFDIVAGHKHDGILARQMVHSELSGIGADDHHARSHDHSLIADGSPIAVTGVPNLPASKITSERFPLARLPDGTLNNLLLGQGAGVDPIYGAFSDTIHGVRGVNLHADSHPLDHRGRQLLQVGLDANKPSAGTVGRIYYATDTKIFYYDNGTAWEEYLRAETVSRLAQLSEKAHSSLTDVTTDQHHAKLHKDSHKSGGTDAFVLADLLDCLARTDILKAGTSIGKRRGLNLIEGSNITLTMTDDAANERVNVTIASTGGGGGGVAKESHVSFIAVASEVTF